MSLETVEHHTIRKRWRPTFVHKLGGKIFLRLHEGFILVHIQEVSEPCDRHLQGAE